MTKLRDNVERWLIQQSRSFKVIKSEDDEFKMFIKHIGAFGNPAEIFEPKKQPNVLVIGAIIALKNNQNARYIQLTDPEKKKFEDRVANYCQSIKAIHKFTTKDGKRRVGAYIVLDKKEQLNQPAFLETIDQVAEMSDKITRYIMKTF